MPGDMGGFFGGGSDMEDRMNQENITLDEDDVDDIETFVSGLSAGMFVGCIAVALAEILNTFPILFRRAKLKVGLPWVMWTMAVGKTCGAFYYFVRKIGEGVS